MAGVTVGGVAGPGTTPESGPRVVDQRAVRVALAPGSEHAGIGPVVVEPREVPGVPATRVAEDRVVLVDALPIRLRLDRFDAVHVILVEGAGGGTCRTRVSLLPLGRPAGRPSAVVHREVVLDGWRVEVEIESERLASLRERARRNPAQTSLGGPTEIRAIIPGRVVSVSVTPGDPVSAGQQLLVVEAMKMQNELRSPRDGVVSTVAVGTGGTIEVGDLLLALE